MLFVELILESGRCDQSLIIFLGVGILSRAVMFVGVVVSLRLELSRAIILSTFGTGRGYYGPIIDSCRRAGYMPSVPSDMGGRCAGYRG